MPYPKPCRKGSHTWATNVLILRLESADPWRVPRQIVEDYIDRECVAQPPTYYFAYGSNLNTADLLGRCPGAKALTPARLPEWRLTFRGVADIEPAPGRAVEGALWRLEDEHVRALDRYEGAPSLYAQELIEVETESGPLTAMTYVMTSGDYLGLPSAWYFDRIARGYRDWGLPLAALRLALDETKLELADQGISRYHPDGKKRLRGIR